MEAEANAVKAGRKRKAAAVEWQWPVGLRFHPTDGEIIGHYLAKKIRGEEEEPPLGFIHEANVYETHPRELLQAYRAPSTLDEDLERFFFTHRELKYPNGKRPNRRAGSGFWKATGSFPDVLYRGKKVGNKRSLVFYEGPDSKKGKKTDWLMQEFVLDDGQYSDSSWVCCKIYYHGRERPAASSMDIPTNAIVQFNSPSSVVNHDEYESVVLPEMLSAEQTRRLGEIYANLSDNFPDATVSTTTTCEYVDAFLLPGAGAAGGDSAADLCCEFFFTDLDCSVRFDSDLATTTTTTEQLAATTKSTAECSLYPVAAETHDWDIPAMDTFGFDQDFL